MTIHRGPAVLSLALLSLATAHAWGQSPPPNPLPTLPSPSASPTAASIDQRIADLERRLNELQAKQGQAPLAPPEPLPPVPPTGGEAIKTPLGLEKAVEKAAAEPFKPVVKLSGFLQTDTGWFSQDPTNRATLGDIQDGTDFRRARLLGTGSISEHVNFSLEMDFAQAGRPSFQDVWGEVTNIPFFGTVRVGQYRQPLSMDSITSIRHIWLLERSLPFQAFDPFRRVGTMAYANSDDQNWSWAYGVYRTGGFTNLPLGDSRFGQDIGDKGGWSFAGRLTHLLYYDEPAEGRYLLHVGGSYDYSRLTGSNAAGEIYDARVIPEFFLGDPAGGGLTVNGTPFFADTGRLNVDQFQYFTLQLAGQYGPAHFQSEYFGVSADQINNPMVYYDGAYLQVGYFLTGENLTYNRAWGVFDKVVPYTNFFGLGRHSRIGGWGAWEVTARCSYVNLNNSNARPLPSPPQEPPVPNAGRLTNLTVGLNWFWNEYAKVQLDWIHCMLDNQTFGDSDCNIYAMRFEVDF